MNVCFFNRTFHPDFGAVGQLLADLAEDLVRNHGCKVTVVAGPSEHGDPASVDRGGRGVFHQEAHEGVALVRVRGTRFGRERFTGRFTDYLSYFLSACYAGLRVPRQDVVVATTDPPIIGIAALIAARRSRAKFVFLCQDVFPEVASLLEDFHSPTVDRMLEWVSRLLVRRADAVIAVGETMRRRLIEGKGADPSRVTVIHNWADCSEIHPGPKKNPFSLSHRLSDAFVVMHSGNVGLSQNLEMLIEAADRLRKHHDIVFAIVGDGVKKSSLEAMARFKELSNIVFLPYQPRERLHESFAAADAFVVSLKARLAGYIVPSKLYGILAAGRPYVAAVEPECEVAAITRRHDCGLVAEPGNAEDLAAKIETLHRDRDLARRLGRNAREAGLNFDRRRQVEAYFQLFRSLADGAKEDTTVGDPFVKRSFDILLSGIGLVLSSPLWILIGLLIKLEDGGPIFFSQKRGGRGGRVFKSWKFRSMVPEAEHRFGPIQARENDPRVTQVGRVLRATALDELPQLWNIFKGDMSFVGPRALSTGEIEIRGKSEYVALEAVPGCAERHAVRPGLTGIAQIYASRDIPRREKFRYDLLYVKRRSFLLDLRLIALSFWITFRGKWETRGQKI